MSVDPALQSWQEATKQVALGIEGKDYIETFFQQRTRPDGRPFTQGRHVSIQHGALSKHASALVQMGDTQVLAAISLKVGQPTTNQGDVIVTINDSAAVLEAMVQRTLLETLDLEQLVIIKDCAAYCLCITLHIIDACGNLRDACLLASVAAINNVKLPTSTVYIDNRIWIKDDTATNTTKSLDPLTVVPIPVSMGLWRSSKNETHWIVDPTDEEEGVLMGGIMIVCDAKSDDILAIDLGSDFAISAADLALACKLASERARGLAEIVLSSRE